MSHIFLFICLVFNSFLFCMEEGSEALVPTSQNKDSQQLQVAQPQKQPHQPQLPASSFLQLAQQHSVNIRLDDYEIMGNHPQAVAIMEAFRTTRQKRGGQEIVEGATTTITYNNELDLTNLREQLVHADQNYPFRNVRYLLTQTNSEVLAQNKGLHELAQDQSACNIIYNNNPDHFNTCAQKNLPFLQRYHTKFFYFFGLVGCTAGFFARPIVEALTAASQEKVLAILEIIKK